MEGQEFIILYTHQKTKKAKTWQDGILKISANGTTKAVGSMMSVKRPEVNFSSVGAEGTLYDDKGIKIGGLHLKPGQAATGEELESDRYLIQIEEVKPAISASSNTNAGSQIEQVPSAKYPSSVAARTPFPSMTPKPTQGLRIGLKRKKSSFIPPRLLKQPRNDGPEHSNDANREDQPVTALQILRNKRDESSEMPNMLQNPNSSSDSTPPNIFSLYSSSRSTSGVPQPSYQSHLSRGSGSFDSVPPSVSSGVQKLNVVKEMDRLAMNSSHGMASEAVVADNKCEINQSVDACTNYGNNGCPFTLSTEHRDDTSHEHRTSNVSQLPQVLTVTQVGQSLSHSDEMKCDYFDRSPQIHQSESASTPPSPWSVVGQKNSPLSTKVGAVATADLKLDVSPNNTSGKRSASQILALIGLQKKHVLNGSPPNLKPTSTDEIEKENENVPNMLTSQKIGGEAILSKDSTSCEFKQDNKNSPTAIIFNTGKENQNKSQMLLYGKHTMSEDKKLDPLHELHQNALESLHTFSSNDGKGMGSGRMDSWSARPDQCPGQLHSSISSQASDSEVQKLLQRMSTECPSDNLKSHSQSSTEVSVPKLSQRSSNTGSGINYSPLSHVSFTTGSLASDTPDVNIEKLHSSQQAPAPETDIRCSEFNEKDDYVVQMHAEGGISKNVVDDLSSQLVTESSGQPFDNCDETNLSQDTTLSIYCEEMGDTAPANDCEVAAGCTSEFDSSNSITPAPDGQEICSKTDIGISNSKSESNESDFDEACISKTIFVEKSTVCSDGSNAKNSTDVIEPGNSDLTSNLTSDQAIPDKAEEPEACIVSGESQNDYESHNDDRNRGIVLTPKDPGAESGSDATMKDVTVINKSGSSKSTHLAGQNQALVDHPPTNDDNLVTDDSSDKASLPGVEEQNDDPKTEVVNAAEVSGFDLVMADWSDEDWDADIGDDAATDAMDTAAINRDSNVGCDKTITSGAVDSSPLTMESNNDLDEMSMGSFSQVETPVGVKKLDGTDNTELEVDSLQQGGRIIHGSDVLVGEESVPSQTMTSTLSTSDTMNTFSQLTDLTDASRDRDNENPIIETTKSSGWFYNEDGSYNDSPHPLKPVNCDDMDDAGNFQVVGSGNDGICIKGKSNNQLIFNSDSRITDDNQARSIHLQQNIVSQNKGHFSENINRQNANFHVSHFVGVDSPDSTESPQEPADGAASHHQFEPSPSYSSHSNYSKLTSNLGHQMDKDQGDIIHRVSTNSALANKSLMSLPVRPSSLGLSGRQERVISRLSGVQTMSEDPLELHQSYPSPLMRGHTSTRSPSPLQTSSNIASLAGLKLDSYKLKGMVSSEVVKRVNRQQPISGDESLIPTQDPLFSGNQPGFTPASQDNTPITPDSLVGDNEETSLYNAEVLEMKQKYDHHNIFGMSAPAGKNSQLLSMQSPIQCVPHTDIQTPGQTPGLITAQHSGQAISAHPNERRMPKREPLRCQPFGDEATLEKDTMKLLDSSQLVPQGDLAAPVYMSQTASIQTTSVTTSVPDTAPYLVPNNVLTAASRNTSENEDMVSRSKPWIDELSCDNNAPSQTTPEVFNGNLAWMDDSPCDFSISSSPLIMPQTKSRWSDLDPFANETAGSVSLANNHSSMQLSSMRPGIMTNSLCQVSSNTTSSKSFPKLSSLISTNPAPTNISPKRYIHNRQVGCDNVMPAYKNDLRASTGLNLKLQKGVEYDATDFPDSIESENPFGTSAGSLNQLKSQSRKNVKQLGRTCMSEWESPLLNKEVIEDLDESFDDNQCIAAAELPPSGASKWKRFDNEDEADVNPALLHYHGRFSPNSHSVGVTSDRNSNLQSNRNLSSISHGNRSSCQNPMPTVTYKNSFNTSTKHFDSRDSSIGAARISLSPNLPNAYPPPEDGQSLGMDSSVSQYSDSCDQATIAPVNRRRAGLSKPFKTPRLQDTNFDRMSSCKPSSEKMPTPGSYEVPQKMVRSGANSQVNVGSSLRFPDHSEVEGLTASRQIIIPTVFRTPAEYKSTIIAALQEHLNVQLCELSQTFHSAAAKVDVSEYSQSLQGGFSIRRSASANPTPSSNPPCEHGVPSKMVQVKKDGRNKGRFFFACAGQRNAQCKFFQWADAAQVGKSHKSCTKMTLSDAQTVMTYFKGQSIRFYCECQLIRKVADSYSKHKTIPDWVKRRTGMMAEDEGKKKMYLKLPFRENHAAYAKDDLWVISQGLGFESGTTFIAKSAFYGPNSNTEVELTPLNGYFPSNWPNNVLCHAIHVGNASSELGCIDNLEKWVHPSTFPILPHLLSRDSSGSTSKGFSAPKMLEKQICFVPQNTVSHLAETYVGRYHLNVDQAQALRDVAAMFFNDPDIICAVSLIHGVFGAGKSYLLAVIVMYLVELFEINESYTPGVPQRLRLLISSNTNVAVDRILLGLLDLGFEEFVRVGSVKKIAKPVLPHSVHAVGSDSQEKKDLQDMLKSSDITPEEKMHVRRSIEQHRRGENKKKLSRVRVVGVTCAASVFQCLRDFVFPVVLLDECSQMTEPTSLLPIAQFQCQKLVLVGDPKQLDPTISGGTSDHKQGLEQTLFDRLSKMGHVATILRTQYRCHPVISAISNDLFYNGQLQDGITDEDRQPLASGWPPLCFLDVANGRQESDSSGSYYNEQEAQLVVEMVHCLVMAGVEPTAIGVCTLYKAQTSLVMKNLYQQSELRGVQVSTVDAFQGGERGVIILSCVRTHYVGFIDCQKRINVALTRAKNHLLIVGHLKNLEKNPLWGRVIQHCRKSPGGHQNGFKFIEEYKQVQLSKDSEVEEPSSEQQQNQGNEPRALDFNENRSLTTERSSPAMSLENADLADDFDCGLDYQGDGMPTMEGIHRDGGHAVHINLEGDKVQRTHRAKPPQIIVNETDFQTSNVDSDDSNDDDLIPF